MDECMNKDTHLHTNNMRLITKHPIFAYNIHLVNINNNIRSNTHATTRYRQISRSMSLTLSSLSTLTQQLTARLK